MPRLTNLRLQETGKKWGKLSLVVNTQQLCVEEQFRVLSSVARLLPLPLLFNWCRFLV